MPLTDAMKSAYWIECAICRTRDIADGSQGIERAQEIFRNRGWRWTFNRVECACCSESGCVGLSRDETCDDCGKSNNKPADFIRLDD